MVIDTSTSNYGAFEHNAASENTPLHKNMKLETPLENQGEKAESWIHDIRDKINFG